MFSVRLQLTEWRMATILQLLILLNVILHGLGQSMCPSGLLSRQEVHRQVQDCTTNRCTPSNQEAISAIFLDVTFNCSGRITQWTAGGEIENESRNSNRRTVLRIWSKQRENPTTYVRTGRSITLGSCTHADQSTANLMNNMYGCNLIDSEQIEVQEGDIVGLDVPARTGDKKNFVPYINFSRALDYRVILLTPSNTSVVVSNELSYQRALPLLSLTVETVTTSTTGDTNTQLPTTVTSPNKDTTSMNEISPPEDTATTAFENATNNSTQPEGRDSSLTISVTMTMVFVGLGLMPIVIIVLALALACSLRRNRKLKKKMKRKERSDDNMNSSVQDMLSRSSSRDEDEVISMEENIAYDENKRRESENNEYVINELVYTSIGECDTPHPQIASPTFEDVSRVVINSNNYS